LNESLIVAPAIVLAYRCGRATPQFTRRFRASTEMAPGHYIVPARIESARHLLAESTMTITQIAADLGYHDPAHFSRQYRRYTGQPPSTHRPPGPP